MPLPIPNHFVRTQTDLHGDAGLDWLARLPELIEACARRWHLTIDGVMKPLTYNYLVSARQENERPVVLKLCSPTGEFAAQRAALQQFAGHGSVQLLAFDDADEVLLMERCVPGTSLLNLSDDDAIEIAGSTMRALWKPPSGDTVFPTLSKWGEGLKRLRRHFGGTGPFAPSLVEQAERTFAAFDASSNAVVLLHGDLHHDNILAAQREPWLAIDPKGVLGVPEYEPATFVIQKFAFKDAPDLRRFLQRRIDGLAEAAGLDRNAVHEWAIAHAVLSAWWTVEDHGRVGEFALACAEALSTS